MFMVSNQTNLSLLNVRLFFNDSDQMTDPTAPYNFEIVSSANSKVIMRHVFYLNNAIKFQGSLINANNSDITVRKCEFYHNK